MERELQQAFERALTAAEAHRNGAEDDWPEDQRGDAWEPRVPAKPHPDTRETVPVLDAWEQPLPLSEIPTVAPFPVEVFPAGIQRFAEEAARATGCPLDFLGLPILVIAGGAIGASRALEVKAQWVQRPLLYGAVVGDPGDGKTPALDLVAKPIYQVQQKLKTEYEAEFEEYEEHLTEYRRAKKEKKQDADAKESDPPKKPHLQRIQVDDATVESLAPILSKNGRGIIMIRDELAAWVTSANQYKGGKGSDRQFWLKNWAGVAATVDRKLHDAAIIIPHPFVAVVGGIQPELLATLRDEKGRSDGFLDRILFAFPEARCAPEWTWEELPEETLAPWRDALNELLRLNMEPSEHGRRPHFVRLALDAREAWTELINAIVREQNRDDFPALLKGPWAKLKVYAARIALIVHFLRWVTGEAAEQNVDAESLRRARLLVRYFQSQAKKVYAVIDADPEVEEAKRVLQWVRRSGRKKFKRWEAHKDLQTKERFPRIEHLDRPLQRLVKHHYLRIRVLPKRQGGGRPPEPDYEVSPSLEFAERTG